MRTRDLASREARLRNSLTRLGTAVELRNVTEFATMRRNQQRAVVVRYSPKAVANFHFELPIQLSIKRDKRHLYARSEVVLQLLSPALIAAGRLHFLRASFHVES